MKNKKGQVIFYGLMVGLVVLLLALALAPAVSESTTRAMNETVGDAVGLNCTTTDSNFLKAACVATDITLFYFIGFLIFLSGAIVTAKWYFGGVQ